MWVRDIRAAYPTRLLGQLSTHKTKAEHLMKIRPYKISMENHNVLKFRCPQLLRIIFYLWFLIVNINIKPVSDIEG